MKRTAVNPAVKFAARRNEEKRGMLFAQLAQAQANMTAASAAGDLAAAHTALAAVNKASEGLNVLRWAAYTEHLLAS